jgi:glycosyltransferase involved in cell wall biosynthesis
MSDVAHNPLFSIITACFNSVRTLPQTLASVRSQVDTIFEHLIIDGGSTDGSLDVVKASLPLSQIVSEPDDGIYDAMNKGIMRAKGEILGILNADDFYASSDVLAKVALVFEDPSVHACFGDLVYVDSRDTGEVVRYWRSGGCEMRKFFWGWMPPHPTFFVRRSIYERYGLFNLKLGSAADYELMLRFLVKFKIKAIYLPEVLVKMRTGGVSNMSWQNRLKANTMDRKAWVVNDLRPYPWTLYLKPLRKAGQWFIKK